MIENEETFWALHLVRNALADRTETGNSWHELVRSQEQSQNLEVVLPLLLSFWTEPVASLQSYWGQPQSRQGQQGSKTTLGAYTTPGNWCQRCPLKTTRDYFSQDRANNVTKQTRHGPGRGDATIPSPCNTQTLGLMDTQWQVRAVPKRTWLAA